MTITIDLPNEVHQRLEKQAELRGTTVSDTIARLIEEVEAAHLSAVVKQMQAEGLFAAPPAAPPAMPPDFEPIQVQGQPLSETILAERR